MWHLTLCGKIAGSSTKDTDGAVVTVDCVGSLPLDVKWCNGIPISVGAVCVSNEASAYWSNGISFTSYGAISVVSA